MAWTEAQQAAIARAQQATSGSSGFTPEQQAAIDRAKKRASQDYVDEYGNTYSSEPVATGPKTAEGPGLIRRGADVAVSFGAGIPKAAGAIVGLGNYVPYLEKLTAPVAQGLQDAGTWGESKLLSDFQVQRNEEMWGAIQKEVANAVQALPEDSSLLDKTKFVAEQLIAGGGEMGKYVASNPTQVLPLIAQSIPYMIGGGVITKGAKGLGAIAEGSSLFAAIPGATNAASKIAAMSPTVGGAVGEGLISAGDSAVQIKADQVARGITEYDPNILYGLATAPAVAAIGAVSGKVSTKLGIGDADTLATRIVTGQSTDLLQNSTKGVVKRALTGGLVEGAEELLQSTAEQSIQNVATDKPVYSGVGGAAVLGAATGFGMGAGMGALKLDGKSSATDLSSPEAIQAAEDEQALMAQEAIDAQAAADQAALQERAVKEARLTHAKTFASETDFIKQRNDARMKSLDDKTTEIGTAFHEWKLDNDVVPANDAEVKKAQKDFLKAYVPSNDAEAAKSEHRAALDNHVAKMNALAQALNPTPAVDPAAQATDPNPTMDPTVDATAVDATATPPGDTTAPDPVANTAPVQTPAEIATQIISDRGIVVDQKMQEAISTGVSDIMALPAEQRQPAMDALISKFVGAKSAPAATEKTVKDPAEAAAKPPTRKDQLRAYAAQQLGENWETENGDLSAMISDGKAVYAKGAGTKSKFERTVDKIYAEQNPPVAAETATSLAVQGVAANAPAEQTAFVPRNQKDEAAVTYATTELGPAWQTANPELVNTLAAGKYGLFERDVKALAKQGAERGGVDVAANLVANSGKLAETLSGNQRKVFDALLTAMRGSQGDTFVQSGGSFNTEALATAAGLKTRQAAQMALNQIRPKIAKYLGISEADVVTALAATSRGSTEAAVEPDAPVSVMDTAELPGGEANSGSMGTVRSVGASQTEGASSKQNVAARRAETARFKKAGMTDAQIKDFYAKQDNATPAPDPVAERRAEQARKAREKSIETLLSSNLAAEAVRLWNGIKSDGAVEIANLSREDAADWIMSVGEFFNGGTQEQLDADQREIERRNNAEPQEATSGRPTTETDKISAADGSQYTDQPREKPVGSEGRRSTADSNRGASTGEVRTQGQETNTGVTPTPKMPTSIPVGPTSLRPRAIGGTLYSDMSLEALNRLLSEVLVGSTHKGWVVQKWFSDNRDLAIGQGSNTGIVVEFDGDYVSGTASQSKPAMAAGMTDGAEFRSDYINTNAVRSFTLAPDQKLKGGALRLASERFNAVEAADGSRKYTAKGAVSEGNPDTGVVGKKRVEPTDVAQQIADSNPVPRELRNQVSFKEAYAAKSTWSSGLWENPNLTEAATLADWLGGLTQAQWDVINPSFTNEMNPFKNPVNVDAQKVKTALEAVMNQQTTDTGVVGKNITGTLVEIKRPKRVLSQRKVEPVKVYRAQRVGEEGAGVGEAVYGIGKYWSASREVAGRYKDIVVPVTISGPNGQSVQLNRRDALGNRQKLISALGTVGLTPANRETIVRVVAGESGVALPDGATVSTGASEVIEQELDIASFVAQTGKAKYNEYDLKDASDVAALRAKGIKGTYYTEDGVVNYVEFPARIGNPKFGVSTNAGKIASRAEFGKITEDLVGEKTNARVHVFDTEADAIKAIENGEVPGTDIAELKTAQPFGWVIEDENGVPHAHFILDRIPSGGEMAAFMHEVGSHVGIDNVLTEEQRISIASQIMDWADRKDGSIESTIAIKTLGRMSIAAARGGMSDGAFVSEAIAYFTEEATLAGITPEAKGPIGEFLGKIYDAFLAALDKIGLLNTDTLTAQDVVNMAWGAARFELVDSNLTTQETTQPTTFRSMPKKDPTVAAQYGVLRDWAGKSGGESATKFVDDITFIAKNAAASTKFLHQFIREVKQTMPAAGRWYDSILAMEKTRNDIRSRVEATAVQARDMAPERLAAVNDFLGKSTFYQKWGYDPQWQGKTVKVDPVMKAAFGRLSAAEQQLVKNVFQHGEDMRQRKIAVAKALGVKGKFFSDASLEGPYAPLKRFGNFAGELKSQELIDAEKAVVDVPNKLNRDKADKLKSSADHYVISFFDTMGSAQQFVDKNSANFSHAVASERAPDVFEDRVSNPEVFEKVLGALKADSKSGLDANAKKAFADMVKSLYFQSLDERSARLSGSRRLNRAGYESNMIRSFLSHARSEAALISNMEHGAETNTAFAEAANEAKADRTNLQPVYNMMAKHYKDTLSRKETPIQDRIAAMNSVYMLTTSVGYHVTNATQPIMVTVPRIAGDFGDYSGTWSALLRGYKVAFSAARMNTKLQTEIDLTKAPPQYRALLEELQKRQLLDVGMEEDLSNFDRFNSGYEALNKVSDVLGKVTHKLYQAARYVEAHNRISSAIAAYDMANANKGKLAAMKMTAEEYATAVVEDTQGNFSRMDAPLLIKSLPKLTTQYRKYQLMMAWSYANATTQAFSGETPEVKAMGRRTLGYMLAHAGLFAGATGIPLLSTLAPYALAFMGGGDEPDDLERFIRDKVDDERLADALTRGLPAFFGIDMSTKLSQGNIFTPFPYVDLKPGESGAKDLFFNAVAGPSGTTFVNFFRAAEYYQQGDMLKGLEYSVPKGIRSAIETYRYASEGFSAKNGDVVMDPRNIDVPSLLLNAIGLQSTDINKIKWTRSQQYELDQWFSKESSRIRREYIRAYNGKDQGAKTSLSQEWRDLQDSKDRVRPFFGGSPKVLPRQSIMDLIKAPQEQRTRERKARMQLGTN